MKISWLGHSSFLIETQTGTRIVTDPYESGSYGGAVKYAPLAIDADIVTVSHGHADHCYTKDFTGAVIVDTPESVEIKGVTITGVSTYHDDQGGSARGKNIIFVIQAEGLRVAHFGDLGTTDCDKEILSGLDVAFLPTGGTFTLNGQQAKALIEALKPRVVIPMHYKTPRIDFPIDPVETFLALVVEFEQRSFLEVTPETVEQFKPVVVLSHQR